MSFNLSKKSRLHLVGVHPDIVLAVEEGIKLSLVDFGIPPLGGFRTAEEQKDLFLKGASRLDGYEKASYHQSGRAVDIYAYANGKASYDPLHLSQCAAAILQGGAKHGIHLEWGGLWSKFQDMPHFQLPKIK